MGGALRALPQGKTWMRFHLILILEFCRRALCEQVGSELVQEDAATLTSWLYYAISVSEAVLVVVMSRTAFLWLTYSLGPTREPGSTPTHSRQPEPLTPECSKLPRGQLPEGARIDIINASPQLPRGVVYQTNALQPCAFHNDVCSGNFLFIHKPTDDPSRLDSGDFLYSSHMLGRKRIWEFRLQMTIRRPVRGKIFFGCEQDRYYYISPTERMLGKWIQSLLKQVSVGMYQTHGEDPEQTEGEPERPCVSFPLWVMDQLIITSGDERAPNLCDPDFASKGMVKSHDRQGMKKVISDLEFVPGSTYTFSFWCIAQFVDAIRWRIPGGVFLHEKTLSALGTHPPCYITMYALKPREEWASSNGCHDGRHLDSRKDYMFRVGFWSTLASPDDMKIKELTASPKCADTEKVSPKTTFGRMCCGF